VATDLTLEKYNGTGRDKNDCGEHPQKEKSLPPDEIETFSAPRAV
jgi:hypothetical protein